MYQRSHDIDNGRRSDKSVAVFLDVTNRLTNKAVRRDDRPLCQRLRPERQRLIHRGREQNHVVVGGWHSSSHLPKLSQIKSRVIRCTVLGCSPYRWATSRCDNAGSPAELRSARARRT